MLALVHTVQSDGVVLTIEDEKRQGEEVWLPAAEWSDGSTDDWQTVFLTLAEGVDRIDVLETAEHEAAGGRPVVSRRRFMAGHVDESWKWHPRVMHVTELSRTLIRGTIGAVRAVAPRDAYEGFLAGIILPAQLRDHGVVGRGDWLSGVVSKSRTEHADVELDLVQCFQMRSEELSDQVDVSPLSKRETQSADVVTEIPRLAERSARRVRSLMLVENDHALRESLSHRFRQWGLVTSAFDSLAAANRFVDASNTMPSGDAIPDRVRLAIIDPNLNPENDDLHGMTLVKRLSEDAQWRTLVVTGELPDARKRDGYGNVLVHGFHHKPFTPEGLVEAIEQTLEIDRPRPLSDWIREAEEDEDVLPKPPVSARGHFAQSPVPVVRQISSLLGELANFKKGAVVHVFAVHGRSLRARSLGESGEGLKWLPFRGKIAKSRIKDAAFANAPIVEQWKSSPRLHFWTRQMLNYNAFCGIPIDVGGPYRHALVAFHPDGAAFDAQWVARAETYAQRVARILETDSLLQTREQEAGLVASGMAFECLAHELRNDLTGLSVDVDVIYELVAERLEGQTGQDIDPLRELKEYRGGVAETIRKVDFLSGVRAPKSPIVVQRAVREAGMGCRKAIADLAGHDVARSIRIDVLEEPYGEECYAKVVPAGLVVVVFNLYLNAVQQMMLMSGLRKKGHVWATFRRACSSDRQRWGIIQVHDTGPGIHQDDWERVFEPGYSTKEQGTGLGLYICRHLLNDMSYRGQRAELKVTRSVLWDGTTMTVKLPLVPSEEVKNA